MRLSGKVAVITGGAAGIGFAYARRLLDYVTSKGAVVAMTRALARELGPDGITGNAVASSTL